MAKPTAHSLAIQRQLVQALASGLAVSGQDLAQRLGISRAAIQKHMHKLQDLGLEIYAIPGQGYRLAQSLQLLDHAAIRRAQLELSPNLEAEIWLQHVTDSTNSQLLKRVQDGQQLAAGTVLVAEAQTAGRGRRGKHWVSPFGSNLYFSMYWPLEQGIQAAMGLSLVVGIAVAQVLEQCYQLPVQLKWPNDIYLDGAKVGGILIELAGQSHAQCDVIIGLGLNINMPASAANGIEQAWTSLQQHCPATIDRNQLIARLQYQLTQCLRHFCRHGFAHYVAEFNQRDLFYGQVVTLMNGQQKLRGHSAGVDQQGALLLRSLTEHGELGERASHYSGELMSGELVAEQAAALGSSTIALPSHGADVYQLRRDS